MKIKSGFVLRTVVGETIALPTDGSTNQDMMITLNDTARFLWEKLEQETTEEELTAALLAEYDVDEVTASQCVSGFIAKLKENDFLA